jgi:hypothetical protein
MRVRSHQIVRDHGRRRGGVSAAWLKVETTGRNVCGAQLIVQDETMLAAGNNQWCLQVFNAL